MENGVSPPGAGWYPDPAGGPGLRWWDGAMWSSHVHMDGVTSDEGHQPLEALQWLSHEPAIYFHELEPGTYGGRVDLVSPDGRFLGWAGRDQPSEVAPASAAIDIHLHAATAVRLATLRREGQFRNRPHPVFDSSGTLMGAFVPRTFSHVVDIETGAGIVGHVNTTKADTWLQSTDDTSLAHLQRTSQTRLFQAPRDTYCLQVLAPMPPWLFAFALLLPIEVDLRVADGRRSAARGSGISIDT